MGNRWKWPKLRERFAGLSGDGKINFLTLEERLVTCFVLIKSVVWAFFFLLLLLVVCFVVQWILAYTEMVGQKTEFESYVKDHAIDPLVAEEKKYDLWIKQLRVEGKTERLKHRELLYMLVLAPQGMQLKSIHFSDHAFEVEGLVTRQDLLENYQKRLQQYVREVEIRGNAHKEESGEIFTFRLEGREKDFSATVAKGKKDGNARK